MRFRPGLQAVLLVSVAAGLALLPLGCAALNPARRYEETARQLRFSLDRVEPKVELAFPLEQSRLRLRLEVGVDNPTDQRLRTRRVAGELRLRLKEDESFIGTVTFPEGADVAARGHSTLRVDVVFGQKDLQAAWGPLSRAVLRHDLATWTISGEARFEVLGIEFGVPFRARRESGE